ncbi:MAG: SDR family oxidoreductase, partial [Gammaproteobacteria bacterium]|jgi:NAD(P)-dependent dehydrogenase (short-subunit alcohol dehydrogenase family)|nr:short-chain dehydrogenase [Gammaproteobacteria bacterium]MBQ08925.1 short-chain dehydrogenase [Gammaproteobacteria bacterium]MDP6146728.1 SDR family oxidoreductase [Gammaproteobacteria bacterium]HJM08797.1 SDR family oxidoreductase [Gammaproteobacteria bacterium]HJN00177.1 SDR family oxidoreductase [Gammaproteobacteria bacterium]|tara:strand:+ start:1555 stop:2376 length:822 start_codon:yes stop_codon:yes gene_type:complete
MSYRYFSLFVLLSTFLFLDIISAKTVLITGSNRGMGLEFVTQYAEKGWDVIATSRSPLDDYDLINAAKDHPKIQIEQMDVTSINQIQVLAQKYENQPIDLLINNAGMSGDRDKQAWGQIDQNEFEKLMSINAFGALKITEAFAQNISMSDDKKVVAISSVAGSISSMGRPSSLPILSISKAALNMAMKTVALRLKDQGVTVILLNPGAVDTRALRQAFGLSLEEAEKATNFDYRGYPTVSAVEGVERMINVIESIDQSQSGSFFNFDGKELPW